MAKSLEQRLREGLPEGTPAEKEDAVIEMVKHALALYCFTANIQYKGRGAVQLGRRDQRKLLATLRDRALALEEAILQVDEKDVWTRALVEGESADLLSNVLDDARFCVAILANSADAAREKVPKKGAPPNEALELFVGELKEPFTFATGTKPTMRYSKKDKADYGPFLNFASAMLTPVNSKAAETLEGTVRKVLYGSERA
jgi:hypothetical protein